MNLSQLIRKQRDCFRINCVIIVLDIAIVNFYLLSKIKILIKLIKEKYICEQ